ncbi:DUF2512 family protein [Virgibacillus salexigens]|uniref:DUF2512 family protein n=1 Tax=Virgibacillus salexigens TaxID=61016 RepID=UPI00190D83F9|nr:DUF2512 family protein [Virgibacillus salexigens]
MIALIIKLIVCPTMVVFSDLIFPNVNYSAFHQPIIVGITLAVIGHAMEALLLTKNTFWLSLVLDFIAAILIVYFVSLFFQNTIVTFFGAFLTALVLGVTEIVHHRWLLQSDRIQKSPA